MAEEEKQVQKKSEEDRAEILVRIMGSDIPGSKSIYPGLTRIKGVSWSISNSVCHKLAIPKSKKIAELSKEDLEKIGSLLKELPVPEFLKNRRFDRETGETGHYYGTDLDLKTQFDIKRMKQIKSYKGIRHTFNLPVRGQRTRSNFRKKGRAVGVKRKKLGKKS